MELSQWCPYTHAAECKACKFYVSKCRGVVVWTEEGCRTAREWAGMKTEKN